MIIVYKNGPKYRLSIKPNFSLNLQVKKPRGVDQSKTRWTKLPKTKDFANPEPLFLRKGEELIASLWQFQRLSTENIPNSYASNDNKIQLSVQVRCEMRTDTQILVGWAKNQP